MTFFDIFCLIGLVLMVYFVGRWAFLLDATEAKDEMAKMGLPPAPQPLPPMRRSVKPDVKVRRVGPYKRDKAPINHIRARRPTTHNGFVPPARTVLRPTAAEQDEVRRKAQERDQENDRRWKREAQADAVADISGALIGAAIGAAISSISNDSGSSNDSSSSSDSDFGGGGGDFGGGGSSGSWG